METEFNNQKAEDIVFVGLLVAVVHAEFGFNERTDEARLEKHVSDSIKSVRQ